jgi:hypothetical protein
MGQFTGDLIAGLLDVVFVLANESFRQINATFQVWDLTALRALSPEWQ